MSAEGEKGWAHLAAALAVLCEVEVRFTVVADAAAAFAAFLPRGCTVTTRQGVTLGLNLSPLLTHIAVAATAILADVSTAVHFACAFFATCAFRTRVDALTQAEGKFTRVGGASAAAAAFVPVISEKISARQAFSTLGPNMTLTFHRHLFTTTAVAHITTITWVERVTVLLLLPVAEPRINIVRHCWRLHRHSSGHCTHISISTQLKFCCRPASDWR